MLPVMLSLFSCITEPKYNIDIPPKTEIPSKTANKPARDAMQEDVKLPSGEEEPISSDALQVSPNCSPMSPEQMKQLTDEKGNTLSIDDMIPLHVDFTSVATPDDQILLDILDAKVGEILFNAVCFGGSFSFMIPPMLGEARLAVFIDADKNGPSANDLQGISEPFMVIDTEITMPPIAFSTTPLPMYKFGADQNDSQQIQTQ